MMTRDYAAPDWRKLCAELARAMNEHAASLHRASYSSSWTTALTRARAALAAEPVAPAEGEVAELVACLRDESDQYDCIKQAPDVSHKLRRAADLLEQRHPTPVPVSERPWERDGWCDDEDRCWCMSSLDGPPPRWWLVRPEPLSDGWVLPAHALPLPAGGGAVMTTHNRPPLWEVMADAFDKAVPAACLYGTEMLARCKAAEIRALRDWLVPEESIEDAPGRFVNGCCLEDRQRLRALLTAEADRAERGEHG